ncbi:WG repeat-containing protein [Flammeovirga aprica]|uniref:WG repeat-containing protein n=1 Tax=Flammeovirga aprica JL-4 TaxID=694437 RepID=A0A7X9P1R7_9BACT|nr:WG repeat-containing protein [Flammeovirga aprica]NME67943.1 WG repeat-containing protein [Flammeovirga aprica JL-4]
MKATLLLISLFFILTNSYGQDFELVPYRFKNKWGFADSTATVKIKPVYQDVIPFNRGLAAFKRDNKWGFIDLKGKEVLEAKYDSVGTYFQGYYAKDEKASNKSSVVSGLLVYENGKGSIVDITGKVISTVSLMFADEEEETAAYKNKIELIKLNDKVGFKIKKSGFTIEPLYDSLIYADTDMISMFGNRETPYFLAMKDGKWGIITTRNTEKLAFEYDNLIDLEFNGKKLFKKNGKWGVMDQHYSVLLHNEYDSLIYENGNYLAVSNGKWGVLDYNFKSTLPFDYEALKMSSDEKGFYVKKGNWGFCDTNGELKVPTNFSSLEKLSYTDFFKFSNDIKKKKFGLFSLDQTIKIDAIYDDIAPFTKGYSLVTKKGKRGYINEKGVEFFKK